MKKVSVFICALVLFVLFLSSNSFAISFGMYIDKGNGSGEAEYDETGAEEFDIDLSFFGLGFQFETNPLSAKKAFSYRFQAGIESRDMEDEENATLELGGLVINNTFAFGRNTSKKIRLWIGPQVLVGFYSGETDKEYFGDEISYSGNAFALGFAGGANFGLGNGKTILTTTIGARTVGFSGNTEWYDEDEQVDGNYTELFISVGILF